jgi:hypothetical protein
MWELEDQIKLYKAGKPLSKRVNLTFPIGQAKHYEYHLEANLFGVKMRDDNDSRPLPVPGEIVPITNCSCESAELTASKAVSYIDFVEVFNSCFCFCVLHKQFFIVDI